MGWLNLDNLGGAGAALGFLRSNSSNKQMSRDIAAQNENIRRANAAMIANTTRQVSAANMNLLESKSMFTKASMIIASEGRKAEGAIAVSGIRGSGADRARRTASMSESAMKEQSESALRAASYQHGNTVQGLQDTLTYGIRRTVKGPSSSNRLSNLVLGAGQGYLSGIGVKL